MKLENAKTRSLLVNDDGSIHGPFSLYLNMTFDNPHTRASVATALRMLDKFIDAFKIDLALRALDGECLTEGEKQGLRQLAYRPITEIEQMSDRMIRRIAETTSDIQPRDKDGAVEPNTAARRLDQIAGFLKWYGEKVLEPRMPLGSAAIESMRRTYESSCGYLKTAIEGTKGSHPQTIRSAPRQRFLDIYSKVFIDPELVFQAPSGKATSTLKRDRAIVLLAAEGMRPGAIGNIQRANFSWQGGKATGYVRIRDNLAKRKKPVTTGMPTQKGVRSKLEYNSEITISLWPTTCAAIQEYLDGERNDLLGKTLMNNSQGFLFLANHGGPIGNRGTVAAVFKRAERGLRTLKLLAKAPLDPYLEGEEYDFTAYLMRHSAASLFYETNEAKPDVKSQMNGRFGWTVGSAMPDLYARRAINDSASVNLSEFLESLLLAMKNKRGAS